MFACADLLIARQPSAPSGFVSSFLAGPYGKPLVKRCGYGSAQPHISPLYVGLIPVPRLGAVEQAVDDLVDQSVTLERKAASAMAEAENTLLDALGLRGWSPPEPLTYTRSVTAVAASGRLDANYFAPKYDAVIDRMRATGASVALGDGMASLISRGGQPDYAPTGLPVINSKHVRINRVIVNNDNRMALPRALRIRMGDVLINGTGVGTIGRVGPYLGNDEALPDNHVTIVRPAGIDALYLSVFLNSRIGQLQIERMISGSSGQIELYPDDIRKIEVWNAPADTQRSIAVSVRAAFDLERQSESLLAAAKRAVEIAIEDSEVAALHFISEQTVMADAPSADSLKRP